MPALTSPRPAEDLSASLTVLDAPPAPPLKNVLERYTAGTVKSALSRSLKP